MKSMQKLALAVLVSTSVCAFAQEEADINTIVSAVKARPDFRALCQGGVDAVRKAVGETTTQLAQGGRIKGDPRAAGNAAGPRVAQECRG